MKNTSRWVRLSSYLLLSVSLHAANTFPSSGDVGIGTTSPADNLHVAQGGMVGSYVGNSTTSSSIRGVKARGTTSSMSPPDSGDYLFLIGGGGYNGTTLYNYNKGMIAFRAAQDWTSTANGTYITFEVTPSDSVSRSQVMRITDKGSVGVGTTAPWQKLHVAGNILASDATEDPHTNGFVGIKARGTTSSMAAPQSGDALVYLSGGGYNGTSAAYHKGMIFVKAAEAWSATANGTYMEFEVTPNGAVESQKAMRIAPTGNVGIGTESPTHKLSVNGAIRAKEVIVDTGWADYVFAPDYRLAPLAEVEAHIKEKGHLPDVPSAKEVAEKGVSVGESQALLLRKVEELTLHVIALSKADEEQKTRIRQLEALISGDALGSR